MKEKRKGPGRPRKQGMNAEQREEWYTMKWSLLQVQAAQIKDGKWNGTPDEKREQIRQLQWMWQNILTPWVRQLKRELREQGEPVE